MPQFAANLSMMFNEHAFLDRFAAAADAGFNAVEFLFPYEASPGVVAERLKSAGMEQALFNLPPGDWEDGERGLAALPGREKDFAAALSKALEYADALACKRLHVMSGIVPSGADLQACEGTYLDNLTMASEHAAQAGVTLLIEPINGRDMPGYFLNRLDDARRIIERVKADNLALQFDFYHTQITHGDLATNFREYLGITGHVQVAGVPERHEPNVGEINYDYLFKAIDSSTYDGFVGCEYRPRAGTIEGLGWLKDYRSAGSA